MYQVLYAPSEPVTVPAVPAEASANTVSPLPVLPVKPETLTVSLQPSESFPPGLFLFLLALVPSKPSATVTFADQSGHLVANASGFFTSSGSHPWLTNHTLRMVLSGLSGEVSRNSSSGGAEQRNLSLTGQSVLQYYTFVTVLVDLSR